MKQSHLIPDSSYKNKQNFLKSLENINFQLEEIKEKYKDPLDGILKYNTQGRCTTFFGDKEGVVSLEEVSTQKEEIKKDIQKVSLFLIDVKNNITLPESIKEVYVASLTSMIKRLEMFQNALRIEAEKSGFSLSNKDRLMYNDNSICFLKEIYGEKVSDTPQEVESVLSEMYTVFHNGKEHIGNEEQQIFQNFLDHFKTKFGYHPNSSTKSKPVLKSTNSIQSGEHIDKEKLKKISQDIIDFYKEYSNNVYLQNWKVIFDKGIDSINISGISEQLRIPESYKPVSTQKVTETIASHEIEQHLLQWAITNKFLGKGFSSGGYDFISEGMAKINELIATGKVNSLTDLKDAKEGVSIGLIGVFICENYNFKEAIQLLKIYKKLTTPGITDEIAEDFAKKIVTRRKRFVSYDLPGSSPKDTLYQRGKNRVIDHITENGDIDTAIQKYKNLNTFKLGPKEIHLIQQIKDELNIAEDQIIYPLFIGRMLADKLFHGQGSTNNYLTEMKLNSKDINIDTQKKLIKILEQLKD